MYLWLQPVAQAILCLQVPPNFTEPWWTPLSISLVTDASMNTGWNIENEKGGSSLIYDSTDVKANGIA